MNVKIFLFASFLLVGLSLQASFQKIVLVYGAHSSASKLLSDYDVIVGQEKKGFALPSLDLETDYSLDRRVILSNVEIISCPTRSGATNKSKFETSSTGAIRCLGRVVLKDILIGQLNRF